MDKKLFTLFDDLNIKHTTLEHAAIFTADEDQSWKQDLDFPVKNLFLRDKARQHYLVTVHVDTPAVDLKTLAKTIGAKDRFSFGKPEEMLRLLGVTPGSVTPFGLMCDDAREVKFYMDERVKDKPSLSAHPLRNDRTTTISCTDFEKFLTHTGHSLEYINVPLKR
jgi:Ala-tRNA(Pro) deacylase